MTRMLRVVAAFCVVEPFEHELGGCCGGKELRLQQGGHGLKKLAHQNYSLNLISLALFSRWLCLLLQNGLLFCS